MRTFLKSYAAVALILSTVLTLGFGLAARDEAPTSIVSVLLVLETPGTILRPDGWLFYHPAFDAVLTSVLSALVWAAPILVLYAIVRAVQARSGTRYRDRAV